MARRFVLLLACWLLPLAAAAQSVEAVKVAYLYNFTKFVTWPAPKPELTLCVEGDASFASALKAVEAKSTAQRRLQVLAEAAEGRCDIVYAPAGSPARHAGKPVLTVGEGEEFLRKGGIIGFVLRENKVRLVINLAAARRAGLVIDPQLLEIAVAVEGGR